MDQVKKKNVRGDKDTLDRKARLLYLMDYMRLNSDEDHPVKLNDIKNAITDRGIYTTRKAIYDDKRIWRPF